MSTNKFSKYVVENIVTGTQIRSIIPAGALDSAAVIDLIDSDYVAARTPSANGFDSADVIGIVDSDYVQARVTLDGVGIDSATAQSIANSEILSTVDAPYVQARQTPQDFAYSSLTGAPTALSSFTNDTNYITAADIPATVDSDYVAARAPAGGLDSAAIGGVEVFSYKTRLITNEDRFAIGQNANINNNGEGNIAIGFNAAANGGEGAISLGKSTSAGGYQGIAIGVEAKADENYSISMGVRAGANGGTESGILIGYQCGLYMSNSPSEEGNVFLGGGAGAHSSLLQAANFFNRTVAIGYSAATKTTGETADAIAIGYRAGQQEMGSNSINIGRDAGRINAGDNSITINATGLEVNNTDQYAIDIRTSDSGSVTYATDSDWVFGATVNAPAFVGDGSGLTGLPSGGGLDSAGVQLLIDDDLIGSGLNSVAIGNGATSVGAFNVSVGLNASAPGQESISIGRNTIGFGDNAVAIGPAAKSYNGSVTIGHDAHAGENGIDTVVIGGGAGGDNTGIRSVAIGFQSGGHTHGAYSPKFETTHIGGYAGRNDPQAYSTGIGALAGGTTQGTEAVAIGRYAGNDTQGANAVAIGSWAALTSQPANSIAISAIGNTPTGTASPDGQYGIRIQTSDSGSLTYDTTNDWTFGAGVTMTDLTASGVVIFSALPTADPVNAGQLWNDGGT